MIPDTGFHRYAVPRVQKTAPLNFCTPPAMCKKPLCLIFALLRNICLTVHLFPTENTEDCTENTEILCAK